jgi:hypothetical protein
MQPLAAVERFLERLFERQSARLFRTRLQPVQIQRRIERAMESARTQDLRRTYVPNRFTVRLHPDDLAALHGSTPTLAADLADEALAFARAHGYTLPARPNVTLRSDPTVALGDVLVGAVVDRADGPGSGVPAGGLPGPDGATRPDSAAPDHTALLVVPASEAPRATLTELGPAGPRRRVVLDGRPLTIGRAADNGLVLDDGRVSRHHARLQGRRGTLVLADLGSTNGSFVNDERVIEIALGEGDRIRLGDTILLVESVATG